MGDWSYLCFVPADSATVPIDWTKVPETFKRYLERWSTGEEIDKKLPETIGDLGQMLNGSKSLGYMYPKLCTLFLDISEFGLKPKAEASIDPRFYMRSDENVSFILFMPGERMGIMGHSPYLGNNSSATDEGEDAAADRALAEEYDLKFCQEYRGVLTTKKIAGWETSTLEDVLEGSQLTEAMLTLPHGLPGIQGLCCKCFQAAGSLRSSIYGLRDCIQSFCYDWLMLRVRITCIAQFLLPAKLCKRPKACSKMINSFESLGQRKFPSFCIYP